MATNASTWFYNEPEHNAYLLEERVNHTLWSNRLSAVYLDCLSETPPFKMSGTWHELPITIEWVPRDYFTLTTLPDSQVDQLIVALKRSWDSCPRSRTSTRAETRSSNGTCSRPTSASRAFKAIPTSIISSGTNNLPA